MSQTLPIQQRPNQNHLPQGGTEEEGDVNAPPDQKTTRSGRTIRLPVKFRD